MTTPVVDKVVQAALRDYANQLKASYSTVGVAFGSEEQLKAPVKALLEACVHLAPKVSRKTPSALALLETSVKGTGRPDVGMLLDGLLNGYVELKSPDKPADPTKFKDKHDKAQWKKFQLLPNLIYTNGLEWRLYRWNGSKAQLTGNAIRLGEYIRDGAAAVTDADVAAFATFVQIFFTWKVVTPTTPEGLATLLAPLASLFRKEVAEALAVKGSKIENVRNIWKQTLFPRATDEQFADIYAQTVTYALLLAQLDGANILTTGAAVKTLKGGHDLLANALKILIDDDLQEELGSGLQTLLRVISALNAAAFKAQEERVWLYFYEFFLAAYDPHLRNKYGVYYTPTEVIGVQVRLVDEVLKTHLGKTRGFADDGVVVLDPAAGTGAYPLAVIAHALAEAAKYGAGMIPAVATSLAEKIHAFEILVGPYAVAHLRVSQAVQNAGGVLPTDGAHVYLNDTLESPNATNPHGLPFMLTALTEEHQRAQRVKLETPVMVTIGNPPYDRHDAKDVTRGGWVRHGDSGKDGILEDFMKPVRDAGEGGHLKNLYNDYVYFWRWALWKTFEHPGTTDVPQLVPRPGVVCFITAASYLRGPGFAGMREEMRHTFDELWILDLEGDNIGARKTPNVFAIKTPVCIALGIKTTSTNPDQPAKVHYAKITGNDREEKLVKLKAIQRLADVPWQETMSGWADPFLPGGTGTYWTWPKLTNVFPERFNGMQYKRTWPIGETKNLLERRWAALKSATPKTKPQLFRETPARRVANVYTDIHGKRLAPITSGGFVNIERYAYRSFDRQWMIADERFADRFRPDLWRSHGARQVYMVGMLTKVLGYGLSVTATTHIPDLDYFAGRGGKDVIPLYLDNAGTETNVTPGLLDVLAAEYGSPVTGEDLFAYAYAVLANPAYVNGHADDLTVPGPRLPITKNYALFQQGAKLGYALLNIHTYGERFTSSGSVGPYVGTARNTKAIPSTIADYPTEFSYHAATQTLTVGIGEFSPVSPDVYTYSVSGLNVLQSWLKYRRKEVPGKRSDRSTPLDDLRPDVWTADMTRELLELLWLLEGTLALEATHTTLLTTIEAGPCFTADELPEPKKTDEEEEEDVEEEDNGMTSLFS